MSFLYIKNISFYFINIKSQKYIKNLYVGTKIRYFSSKAIHQLN